MVIIAEKGGQLCNKLFQFSYFIVNGLENGYKVINPCFDEYKDFFETTATNNFKGLSISTKITPFKKLDNFLIRFSNKKPFQLLNFYTEDIRSSQVIYNLNSAAFKDLTNSKIVFTKGWLFKNDEKLKKHRRILLEIFKPKQKYLTEVSETLQDLRSKYDYIIGVHIRRGDYKEWNEGKYFYKDDIYLDKMKQIEKEINSANKSCCFFIASNETINVNSFTTTNICYQQRHFITDLYALAECDYVFGPPSTYSLWAAFYGDIPFLIIDNENTEAKLNNFTRY